MDARMSAPEGKAVVRWAWPEQPLIAKSRHARLVKLAPSNSSTAPAFTAKSTGPRMASRRGVQFINFVRRRIPRLLCLGTGFGVWCTRTGRHSGVQVLGRNRSPRAVGHLVACIALRYHSLLSQSRVRFRSSPVAMPLGASLARRSDRRVGAEQCDAVEEIAVRSV